MNVLFLTGEYPPMRGGVADYTRGLVGALAGTGVNASVLTSSAAATEQVRQTEVLPVVDHWGWSLFGQVREAIAATKASVLHIQYQTGAFAMHPAVNLLPWRLRRNGVPVVTTMHDLRVPYLFPKAGPVRSMANDMLLQHSRAVIVTNPHDYLEAARKVRSGRLTGVPLANNLPPCPPTVYERQSFRAAHGLDDSFVVAHFGMINHSKGVASLVEACAQLRARGVHVRLAFIGEAEGSTDPTNRAELDALHRLLMSTSLSEHVVFTGHLPPQDVSAWLVASDAIALPFTDGASFRRTSLLAALAHGLPVVTTVPDDAPPLADLPVLRHGINCLLATRAPGGADPKVLASMLALLYDRPDIADRISDGARQAAASFTWDRVADAHVNLYQQLA